MLESLPARAQLALVALFPPNNKPLIIPVKYLIFCFIFRNFYEEKRKAFYTLRARKQLGLEYESTTSPTILFLSSSVLCGLVEFS